MKKRILSLVLTLCMLLGLLPGTALAVTGDSESDPIEISTAEGLAELAAAVNGGDSYDSKFIKLTNDIDLSSVCSESGGTSWTPIGTASSPFCGTFDGDGHTVSGLYINNTDSGTSNQGLFSCIGAAGTVKNLTVSGSVNSSRNAGGVAGLNEGTVINCHNICTVESTNYSGGIVGSNEGTVESCHNTGAVIGSTVGGLVGYNSGTIERCDNAGTISSKAVTGDDGIAQAVCVGGIVGKDTAGKVINCYNTGEIKKTDYGNAGGVVGECWESTIENCYNFSEIPQGNGNGNGIVGRGNGANTVINCYYDSSKASDTNGTGITTDKFRDQSIFDGWDFTTVWKMDASLGRPVFRTAEDIPAAPAHTHAVCGADCGHGGAHDAEEFKPLSQSDFDSGTNGVTKDSGYILAAGNYYLNENVKVKDGYLRVAANAEANLCLNGKTLTNNSGNQGPIWVHEADSVLNICDCQGDGKVAPEDKTSYKNACVWAGENGGTLRLYGGTYESTNLGKCAMVGPGGTLLVDGATLNGSTTSDTGYALKLEGSGNATVKSGTLSGSFGVYISNANAALTLNGSPAISSTTAALRLCTSADTALNDAKVDATGYTGEKLTVEEESAAGAEGAYAIKVLEGNKDNFMLTGSEYQYVYENGGLKIQKKLTPVEDSVAQLTWTDGGVSKSQDLSESDLEDLDNVLPASGTDITLTLTGDVKTSGVLIGKPLALTSDETGLHTLGWKEDNTGNIYTTPLLKTSDDGDVTITNTIVDGAISSVANSTNFKTVSGNSQVILGDKATVQNGGRKLGDLSPLMLGEYYAPGGVEMGEIGGCKLTMSDGSSVKNNVGDSFGGIFASYFTMNGGTVEGNLSTRGTGGVSCATGEMTMSNGSIQGNISWDSMGVGTGGLTVNNATLTMSGGSVTGNTGTAVGGLWLMGELPGGAMTMTGGSITGNKAGIAPVPGDAPDEFKEEIAGKKAALEAQAKAGGVYLPNTCASLTISGPVTIKDNTKGPENAPSNVVLGTNASGEASIIQVTGALTGGNGSIGVSRVDSTGVSVPGVVARGSGYTLTEEDLAAFFSDDPGCKLVLENNEIKLVEIPHTITVNGAAVTADPDSVASYQWYDYGTVELPVVDKGVSEEGSIAATNVYYGSYTDDGTWASEVMMGHFVRVTIPVQAGDIVTITPNDISKIISCGGTRGETFTSGDNSYSYTVPEGKASLEVEVKGSSKFTCTVKVTRIGVGAAVSGQTKPTFTGAASGTYVCKVTWNDGVVKYSDPVTITPHTHAWAAAWTTSVTHHWHECSAAGCPITDNSGKDGYGAHSYTDNTCNVCGYTRTAGPLPPYGAPAPDEGYSIDYTQEKITVNSGYEVNTKSDGTGTTIGDGDTVTPGANLYIRKAGDDTHTASGWVEVVIPARPGVPSGVTAVSETAPGANDGKLTGVSADMEYSSDDGTTWKPCPGAEVTPLAPGSYQVRTKANPSTSTFASTPVTVTIPAKTAPTHYTVVFDSQGGSNVNNQTVAVGGKAVKPTDPTSRGYTFGGWYTEPGCVHRWNFENVPTGDLILYAKWVENTYSISGTVTEDNSPVSNATVKLMQGNTTIATTTSDSQGRYSFTSVAPGSYNVVATENGKTMTILVTIESANATEKNLAMPSDNVNSVLEVKGEDTPEVVVGGLEQEAEQNKENGKTVTVTMTVESKDDTADNASDIITIASGKALDFMEIKVEKKVNENAPEAIITTRELLTIIIPFDSTGKTDISVYRYHDSSVNTLTTTANDGEYIEVNADSIILHVRKFSTYAIGYKETAATYTVTALNDGHGTASATPSSAAAGTEIILNATPDSGYRFKEWQVVSGGIIISNNKFTMPAGNVAVKAVFEYIGGGASSSGSDDDDDEPTYRPTVEKTKHGDVTVRPSEPEQGDRVTITVKPDKGYEVEDVTVTDRDGDPVKVKDNGNGTYTFTQPKGKVSIEATFRAVQTPQPVQPAGDWSDCRRDAACPIHAYTDASPAAWYHDGVHYCLEKSLMNGFTDGTFKPDVTLSRAQLAQILYNLEGRPALNGASPFTDVANNAWCASAVIWANQNGIVGGYGNGQFGPNNPITREQLATMLWRYAKAKGYNVSVGEDTNILGYKDFSLIHEYAIPALQWATGAGVMNGKGNGILNPIGRATRAQAAVMLQRYLENTAH